MESVTIYHNPNCSKSRETLQLIRDQGIEPRVIAYLDAPPSRSVLQELLAAMQMPARELLRSNEDEFSALGLNNSALDEDALLDAMHRYPRLINRPIVATAKGVRLCRPPQRVLEIL